MGEWGRFLGLGVRVWLGRKKDLSFVCVVGCFFVGFEKGMEFDLEGVCEVLVEGVL